MRAICFRRQWLAIGGGPQALGDVSPAVVDLQEEAPVAPARVGVRAVPDIRDKDAGVAGAGDQRDQRMILVVEVVVQRRCRRRAARDGGCRGSPPVGPSSRGQS